MITTNSHISNYIIIDKSNWYNMSMETSRRDKIFKAIIVVSTAILILSSLAPVFLSIR